MASPTSLRDQFLISMPHLQDRHFAHTVTYICDHSEYGAMGLVINRPSGMELSQLLPHLELQPGQPELAAIPVYAGGPVHEDRGFVLHRPDAAHNSWLSSHPITDDISLTSSLDILEAIVHGYGPSEYLLALGYAGWGPGQLEQELSDNLWLSCPANLDILFRMPAEERLQAAASILGINLNLLTAHAGHA